MDSSHSKLNEKETETTPQEAENIYKIHQDLHNENGQTIVANSH